MNAILKKTQRENCNDEDDLRTAPDFLICAADAIAARAEQRDQPDGERSMLRAVLMFNVLRGLDATEITETDGWIFMTLLKLARARGGRFHADDYIDAAAYIALAGECEKKFTAIPF